MQTRFVRWAASTVVVAAFGIWGVGLSNAGGSAEAEAAQQSALKLWDEGKGEDALAELNKAVAASPKWLDAVLLRAGIRASLGGAEGVAAEKAVRLLSGALADLKKALKLKPGKGERKKIAATMKTLKRQLVAAKKRQKAEGGAASGGEGGACAKGMLKGPDTAGHCCWPGQEWSKRKERCIGVPTCPEGMKPDGDACAVPKKACAKGQIASAETENNCCWPGQEWSKKKSRCIGTPECPSGMKADGEACKGAGGDGQVLIKGGTYTMGDKKVEVTVGDFYLDKTEVTVAAYLACVSDGKCPAAKTPNAYCNADKADRGTHPINCVDWYEAKNYCEKNGGRLPTEEEWEWAARGRDEGRTYPWGNDAPAGQLCWDGEGNDLGKGNRKSTCAVGSYLAGQSKDGLQDMAGNVWEWTSTVHGSDPGRRVVRGGSWFFDHASFLRAADRFRGVAGYRFDLLGFRCARTP